MAWPKEHYRPAKGAGSGPGWGGPAKGAGWPIGKRTVDEANIAKVTLPPELKERKAMKRRVTRETMMEVYEDVALDAKAPHMARVSAADKWLDRTEGKPAQTNVNLNQTVADDLTPEQRRALLDAVRAKLGATEEPGTDAGEVRH